MATRYLQSIPIDDYPVSELRKKKLKTRQRDAVKQTDRHGYKKPKELYKAIVAAAHDPKQYYSLVSADLMLNPFLLRAAREGGTEAISMEVNNYEDSPTPLEQAISDDSDYEPSSEEESEDDVELEGDTLYQAPQAQPPQQESTQQAGPSLGRRAARGAGRAARGAGRAGRGFFNLMSPVVTVPAGVLWRNPLTTAIGGWMLWQMIMIYRIAGKYTEDGQLTLQAITEGYGREPRSMGLQRRMVYETLDVAFSDQTMSRFYVIMRDDYNLNPLRRFIDNTLVPDFRYLTYNTGSHWGLKILAMVEQLHPPRTPPGFESPFTRQFDDLSQLSQGALQVIGRIGRDDRQIIPGLTRGQLFRQVLRQGTERYTPQAFAAIEQYVADEDVDEGDVRRAAIIGRSVLTGLVMSVGNLVDPRGQLSTQQQNREMQLVQTYGQGIVGFFHQIQRGDGHPTFNASGEVIDNRTGNITTPDQVQIHDLPPPPPEITNETVPINETNQIQPRPPHYNPMTDTLTYEDPAENIVENTGNESTVVPPPQEMAQQDTQEMAERSETQEAETTQPAEAERPQMQQPAPPIQQERPQLQQPPLPTQKAPQQDTDAQQKANEETFQAYVESFENLVDARLNELNMFLSESGRVVREHALDGRIKDLRPMSLSGMLSGPSWVEELDRRVQAFQKELRDEIDIAKMSDQLYQQDVSEGYPRGERLVGTTAVRAAVENLQMTRPLKGVTYNLGEGRRLGFGQRVQLRMS
jgi:hypothetical protein